MIRSDKMFLIVGLGNPGPKYYGTRHNIGFGAIEELSAALDIKLKASKFKAYAGTGVYNGKKLALITPTTYMNLSGEAVSDFIRFYKLNSELWASQIIVIYDDIDIPLGEIRIKEKGSAGGHNGIKNIIHHLDSDEFLRIRIGIGKKMEGQDLNNHVLGHFLAEDMPKVRESLILAKDATLDLIQQGAKFSMNKYNIRKKPPKIKKIEEIGENEGEINPEPN